jgi:hypothetical protein
MKYEKIVHLLTDFINNLIISDPSLVDGNNEDGTMQPQIDIHLNLDLIKSAQNIQEDLDNRSLLALCLVLLKQIQPYIQDFEEQQIIYEKSMMQNSMSVGQYQPTDASSKHHMIVSKQEQKNIVMTDDNTYETVSKLQPGNKSTDMDGSTKMDIGMTN